MRASCFGPSYLSCVSRPVSPRRAVRLLRAALAQPSAHVKIRFSGIFLPTLAFPIARSGFDFGPAPVPLAFGLVYRGFVSAYSFQLPLFPRSVDVRAGAHACTRLSLSL